MSPSSQSKCPFHAALPRRDLSGVAWAITSIELRESLQRIVSHLAPSRVHPMKWAHDALELEASIPLLWGLKTLFEKAHYTLWKTRIYDLTGDIKPEEIWYHCLSELGFDIYQALTGPCFGKSNVHRKSEAIMMLAINPIDAYLMDILHSVKSEVDFDRETKIAHQNIILMASLNGSSDDILHKYRRLNQNGRFNIVGVVDYIESHHDSYIQCIGVTTGYLSALLEVIIPIYRDKYLAQALKKNTGLSPRYEEVPGIY